MTTRQTERVRERVLALTREWMSSQAAIKGTYGGASAYADLDADRYVGVVNVAYTTAAGVAVSGELVWQLDYRFLPVGQPDERLADADAP